MFKFIYELVQDPLGLTIVWYYEWIILAAIDWISYVFAYEKVGILYHGDFISGRTSGSFFHWLIRTLYFVIIWAITYIVIWGVKFVLSHKIEVCIGIGITIVVCVIGLLIWHKSKSKHDL